jgi:sec-independent protein translocase protein TatA
MKRGKTMFGLGTTELIVIGVIIFLIFGAKRIPEIGKGIGGAMREFRQVKKELETDTPDAGDSLARKVAEQIPGVRKAMNVKEKVGKVKDIIK